MEQNLMSLAAASCIALAAVDDARELDLEGGFDLDEFADLHAVLDGGGPRREMTVLERWPESVVAFKRVDQVTWSEKAGRCVIWTKYDFDQVRAYRETGHVRFTSKQNSNKAGKRGAFLCRWASLLNWRAI